MIIIKYFFTKIMSCIGLHLDARIAALCLHHGVKTLWTADRDFSAFATLKALNPLVG